MRDRSVGASPGRTGTRTPQRSPGSGARLVCSWRRRDDTGEHVYQEEGSYTTTITIEDNDGSKLTLDGSATVDDAPLTVTNDLVDVNAGEAFRQLLIGHGTGEANETPATAGSARPRACTLPGLTLFLSMG